MSEQTKEISVDELQLLVQHYKERVFEQEEKIALLRVEVTVKSHYLDDANKKLAEHEKKAAETATAAAE